MHAFDRRLAAVPWDWRSGIGPKDKGAGAAPAAGHGQRLQRGLTAAQAAAMPLRRAWRRSHGEPCQPGRGRGQPNANGRARSGKV